MNPKQEYVDIEEVNEIVLTTCKGKNLCTVHIPYTDIWDKEQLNDDDKPPANTVLYSQVACTAPEDFLREKAYWALACSTLGFLMCMFFRFTMTYLHRKSQIDSKLLDL